MTLFADKFVFANRDIESSGRIIIQKDDVGIIESESQGSSTILFIRAWIKVTLNNDAFEIIDVNNTGDTFPKKICNVCHKLLNTTEFARNQNNINRSVRRPSCQECRKTLEGIKPTPEEKRKWLRTKPQNEPFNCPICGKRTIAGVTSKVVLDHNHNTGKVRGWICDSCNTGIGRFKDDKELLKKAIGYLE
ncbi:hypothetical protein ES703_64183 [subsurface metagenome]